MSQPPASAAAPFEVRLAHAVRCWDAEEENARRLATRISILTTGTLGLMGIVLLRFGVGLTTAGQRWSGQPMGIQAILITLLVAGLLLLAASCAFQFDAFKKRQSLPSSQKLRSETAATDKALREALWSERDDWYYRRVANALLLAAALNIDRAAQDLAGRNAREKSRIQWAQWLLLAGALPLFVALGLWLHAGGL